MSVRRRTWKNAKGEVKEAWIVWYRDQHGGAHTKTFARKKEADAFHGAVKTRVRLGTHVPGAEAAGVEDLAEAAAKKFLYFIDRRIEPACHPYRHYHPNGDLLYVGVSMRALDRHYKHLDGADWPKTYPSDCDRTIRDT